MPVVTLLSWNVEHFGPSKTQDIKKGTTNKNGIGLFSVIAWTAYTKKANVISLLEVSKSTYQVVANLMVGFLNATSLTFGAPEEWRYIHHNSNKGDIYIILYKVGQGFEPLFQDIQDANGSWIKSPIGGSTKLDVNGAALKFQGSKTSSGGREPGYFAFGTTGLPTNFAFSIIAFHGMYNIQPANVNGLESITKIFPTAFVWQAVKGQTQPNKIPISFALMAGDFNVNLLTYEDDYKKAVSNLANGYSAIHASQKKYANTTLINKTPPNGFPNTVDYRSSAYDNILVKPTSTTQMLYRSVIDVLDLIQVGKDLSGPITTLTIGYIKNGGMINSIPPANNEDAWHIYRETISNHLPVLASFQI